jgi:hypothetical protein
LLLVAAIVVSGLVAGVAATSGDARSSTPGDGCLVVSQGFGKITVTLTRGVIFGRFQSGSLSYNDQGGTPSLPKVPLVIPVKLGDHVWKYGPADNLRFRATGPTRLTVNATFIDLSVAGRGSAILSAANFEQTIAGSFSVDAASFCGDNFQQMPLTPARFSISSPVAG